MAAEARQTLVDAMDLKDLEPISKRLNAATDELNASLQSIQDRLNAMAIGVEVWLDSQPLQQTAYQSVMDDHNEPTSEREYTSDELGYARSGDGWALLVRKRRYVDAGPDGYGGRDLSEFDDGHPETPLLRASKNLRRAAVHLIPKLIDAIEVEARRQIASIEKAKQIADSLK